LPRSLEDFALMKTLNLLAALSVAVLFAGGCSNEKSTTPAAPPGAAVTNQASAAANTNEVAVITTSEGVMVIEFYPDVAPKHVENFEALAKKGFYDGTAFHRVIPGFMIQGGDPNTKNLDAKDSWGMGGPGYTINAEFNSKHHARGIVSMARTQDPNSAGSQFFICHGDAKFLDRQYTAFGELVKGDDVLERIATMPTSSGGGGEKSTPIDRVEVESIRIVPAK
jgi:peptidyl-prolyl cis-trans isomerase B (cyclophilin B)